jgi:hypothetical protein
MKKAAAAATTAAGLPPPPGGAEKELEYISEGEEVIPIVLLFLFSILFCSKFRSSFEVEKEK